jgi:hypothetical protein
MGRSRSNKSREFWTGDSETDPFHHCADKECPKCQGLGRVPKPFIWGAYNGEEERYEEFATPAEFAEFFKRKKTIVFAHNGGKFDYHYLRDEINSDEPITLINGRLAKFRIGECEFRDSLNIFPNTSLADFGCKNEIDYDLMEPDKRTDPNVKAEISKYLRQDCVGLWDQVARYRTEFGKWLTQATASMKYWEKHHFEDKAPRQTNSQFERCRPYYYGGRVQCFERGIQRTGFKVADINSAYPKAMLEEHPISPIPILTKKLPKGDRDIRTCLIKLEATARGCFPWRDKLPGHGEGCECADCRKGELYFPDDSSYKTMSGKKSGRTRVYTITGWELIAALEENAVDNVRIIEVQQFQRRISFKDYIEHFYRMRLESSERGDVAGKTFGKYFMNSLYGKFGADCSNYAEYVISTSDSEAKWMSQGYKRYKPWGDRWLMERKPTEGDLEDIGSRWRYYNVATAASITGYVRSFLFRSMMKCSGLIYCDTDSISARDTSRLEFGKELGKWKDEGSFDEYRIAGKKLYAFHEEGQPFEYDPDSDHPSWKIASKGVNLGALDVGPDLVAALARGESITHLPEVPTYSITRNEPRFINRALRSTAKDMSQAPAPQNILKEILAPKIVRI